MYSFEDRGKRLGNLVHDVLSQPPGQPLPTPGVGAALCKADANELERFGIRESRLPSDCEVLFARPSLWREYRWYVAGAAFVLLAQFALILALVLQRRGRRKAEEEVHHRRAELAQASRLAMAGELTASIAHEINQPLGAILANAGAAEAMLRRGVTNSEELRAILADIRQSDMRASQIVRRVRALITTHQVEREPADPNEVVGEVLALLAGEAKRRNVGVDAALESALPPFRVDRVQVQQAIVNLCVNAMDAMADTPAKERRLRVRTRRGSGGDIEIAVSDTGPGIPPEQVPHLFDSFFTTKPHGMGLGLSIARSIVEAHGGTLSAENRVEGAVFRMVMPACEESRPASGDEAKPLRGPPSAAALPGDAP
jgi:C4-dicarboxylate-specific signal transduction histidine kinase